ncbi:MAG TPA: GNAT family N-acetyltransferase [Candidatus Stackebrandtia faecavium]|nr:GNAT family N-acetyltransferase [Candidatus Stackebrandtia faecavium]
MGLRVRPARESELDEVGDITVAAYAAAGLLPPDSDYASELRDAPARFAHSPLLVAEDPQLDGIAGSVTLCPFGSPLVELATGVEELEIRMLSVAPRAQRRGVGEALLSACIEYAREHGCVRVVLFTQDRPIQTPAMRLYERLGFHYVPQRDWQPAPSVLLRAMSVDVARFGVSGPTR